MVARGKLRKLARHRAAAAGTTRQFESVAGSKVPRWAQRLAWHNSQSRGAASPCKSLVVDGEPVTAEGAAALAAASAQMGIAT